MFLIFNKNIQFVKKMQLGWGILLFMGIATPWYILICLQNPDYFEYFFIKQNFGSFFGDVHSRHPRPFYYYLLLLIGGFFPWSLFLPLVLYDAVQKKIKLHREAISYILIWFAAIFLFFSLASSKLGSYILPVFPALSLLIGFFWQELATTPNRNYHKTILLSYIPAVAIFSAALIYLVFFPPLDLEIKFGFNPVHLKYVALLSSGISILALLFLLNRKYPLFPFFIASLMVAVTVFAFQFVMPAIDPFRSTKNLAIKLDDILEPAENLLFYGREKPSALFYTNRKATRLSHQELRKLMDSSKTIYCIVSRDDWDEELSNDEKFATILIKDGDRLIIRN
jgi:4-amino-4-deoxy-L-arabinose transferase-like glycosyltransferase